MYKKYDVYWFLIYFWTNRRIYSRKALKHTLVNYYFGGFRRGGREKAKIDSKTIELNSSNGVLPKDLNAWFGIYKNGVFTRYRVNVSDILIGKWIVPKRGQQILVLDAMHPSLARFYPFVQDENEGLPVRFFFLSSHTHIQLTHTPNNR